MPTQINLPNLGENVDSGDILSLLVNVGDTIEAEQDIVEIETDKATMPVPCPEAGKVVKILVAEGDTVQVGAPLLELDKASSPAVAEEPSVEPAAEAAT